MTEAGTIPAEVAEQLPSTEGAFFPTIEEIEAAKAVITGGWDEAVGVSVVHRATADQKPRKHDRGGRPAPPTAPLRHLARRGAFLRFLGPVPDRSDGGSRFRSLEGADGSLTFDNYRQLTTDAVMRSYGLSIRLSLTTAVIGGIFGFLLAWAVSIGGLGRRLRSALSTFSGVASNFAGVPLAAAFIFTLGRIGVVTAALRAHRRRSL